MLRRIMNTTKPIWKPHVRLTQKEMAEALKVHPTYLNAVLCSRERCSAKLAKNIEEKFGYLGFSKKKLRPDIFGEPTEDKPTV